VNRAAGELSARERQAAVLSLPLRHGDNVVGVVTIERPADRPFEPEQIEALVEALAHTGDTDSLSLALQTLQSVQQAYPEPLLTHYKDVLRYVSGQVSCSQTASDIVQETYTRVLEASRRADISSPRAFLFRTARNLLVDRRRRDHCWRRHAPLLDAEQFLRCPHESMEERERIERVHKTIEALPPKCREVFVLHRFSGMTYAEIAAHANVAVSTVEKHITRALAACRDTLLEND